LGVQRFRCALDRLYVLHRQSVLLCQRLVNTNEHIEDYAKRVSRMEEEKKALLKGEEPEGREETEEA